MANNVSAGATASRPTKKEPSIDKKRKQFTLAECFAKLSNKKPSLDIQTVTELSK